MRDNLPVWRSLMFVPANVDKFVKTGADRGAGHRAITAMRRIERSAHQSDPHPPPVAEAGNGAQRGGFARGGFAQGRT